MAKKRGMKPVTACGYPHGINPEWVKTTIKNAASAKNGIKKLFPNLMIYDNVYVDPAEHPYWADSDQVEHPLTFLVSPRNNLYKALNAADKKQASKLMSTLMNSLHSLAAAGIEPKEIELGFSNS